MRHNGIRQQLQYLGYNLSHIDDLMAAGATLSKLSRRQYRLLWVIGEVYRQRFGRYPASVHADQIYRTRDSRRWCQARGIRLSGRPPLGRPKQAPTVQAELNQQARADEAVRVAVEGKFGQAKRRFSLAKVMPKLAETARCAIAITSPQKVPSRFLP